MSNPQSLIAYYIKNKLLNHVFSELATLIKIRTPDLELQENDLRDILYFEGKSDIMEMLELIGLWEKEGIVASKEEALDTGKGHIISTLISDRSYHIVDFY